ncbi:MAG: M23 family metallopeptidase [Leptospiraceae bacterium]|nr:M23 family metallopeptidase [Leptospiraceae bacterium]
MGLIFLNNKNIYTKTDESIIKVQEIDRMFEKNPKYIARGFNYPVGKPKGKYYYIAQKFGTINKNYGNLYHLGEDWNGIGGGNTDYGDTVYSIGRGLVVFADDCGKGWGNVIRIIHKIKKKSKYWYVESLYAHLKDIKVKKGEFVKRGEKIGTIGNANGLYYAHLHMEVRFKILMPLVGGYSKVLKGYLSPLKFINANRHTKWKKR